MPNEELLDGRCRCCDRPSALLPRPDLGADVAVCPRSGQLHRANDHAFELISSGPPLARRDAAPAAAIRIDLSKVGYA